MSLLVIQIPPRQRLRSQGPGRIEPESKHAADEFFYAASPDGLMLQAEGQSPPALLPKADNIIAVVSDTDVSWHRVTLPKAPASRLRAALLGVLEEAVLDDADTTHFAIAPGAVPGQLTWVAALNRPWLRTQLAALEKANVFVDRVVPAAWPDDPPSGHFAETDAHNGSAQGVALTWSHADGVATLRLHGGLARAVVALPAPPGSRWSASPGAAAAAEQWLGTTVNVMPHAQRLLQAARTLWNLRQFDLARRSRGIRAVRDVVRKMLSPAWRPVRVGAVALVLAHIIGLNLWAWHQQSLIKGKHQAMVRLVQETFPQNKRDVLDAPVEMQRGVQLLRAAAGKPNETDFEPMLQAAATAWPADQPPVERLRYEPGKLSLAATNWQTAQIDEFRARLRPAGWLVAPTGDGQITVSRAPVGGLQ